MLLSKQQKIDAKKCKEAAAGDKYVDCTGCSCLTCLDQVPTSHLVDKNALLGRLEPFLESQDKKFPLCITAAEMIELLAVEKTARQIIKIIKDL